MKDKNPTPFMCTGCFAVSRVYEAVLGRGPAMAHSCRSVVRGTRSLATSPSWDARVGLPAGGLCLQRARSRAKPPLLWVSSSSFSWQACFMLPLLTVLGVRKEVEKCCSVHRDFNSFQSLRVRFWEGNLV